MDDWQLLKEFVDNRSQAAFTTLVERHIHFVYSTCRREVQDAALAEDVTQVVFLLLAKKAPSLREGTVLAGWLFNAARFASRNALKSEMRRQRRDQKVAQEMRELTHDAAWRDIEPLLHDALTVLGDEERNAVFLRFFQGKSLHDTGVALGISEDAARMRVTRAVNKLKKFFLSRGFSVSGSVLAALLGENAVQAAPVGCACAVLQTAQCVTAGGTSTAVVSAKVLSTLDGTVKAMLVAKAKTAAMACLSLSVAGTAGGQVVRSHFAPTSGNPITISTATHRDRVIKVVKRFSRQLASTFEAAPKTRPIPSKDYSPAPYPPINAPARIRPGTERIARLSQWASSVTQPPRPLQSSSPMAKGTLSRVQFVQAPIAAAAPITKNVTEPQVVPAAEEKREAPTVRPLTVAGKVIGPDGMPVKAKIDIRQYTEGMRGWEQDVSAVISTDDNGVFSARIDPMPDIPAHVQQLLGVATVAAPGFVPVTFAPQEAANPQKPLVITLRKGASISGVVRDAAGVPLSGVRVQLGGLVGIDEFDGHTNRGSVFMPKTLLLEVAVVTGDDGRWTMDNVLPNSGAWLYFLHPKWAQQRIDIRTQIGATQVPDVIVRPGATLRGKVTREDGTVAQTGRVVASNLSGNSWGEAVFGGDGSFEIPSLAAGTYAVSAGEPSGNWVMGPLPSVVIKEGVDTQAPAIVMTRGVLVQGQVTDARTGKPVGGARVNIGTANGNSSGTSDLKGQYAMRVEPGKASLYVGGRPRGYLYPEAASPSEPMRLTLEKDTTRTIDLKLPRGTKLGGTIKVEGANIPLPEHLELCFREVGPDFVWDSPHSNIQNGVWSIDGLGTTSYTLAISKEDWEIVSPKMVTAPQAQPIEVRVRPITLPSVKGKIATSKGKPVEKVQIKAAISIPISKHTWRSRETIVESGTDGTFEIPKIKADYRVALLASRNGYKYLRGGTAQAKDGVWTVEEIVMLPLQSRVVGRVVDAAGKAVAGAKVLSPDANPPHDTVEKHFVTDAQGKFELTGLPEGEVTVIAANQQGAATLRAQSIPSDAKAPEPQLEWKLRPYRVVTTPDVEGAYAILQDAWETSRGSNWNRRNSVPSELVAANFEAALELASGGDSKKPITEDVLTQLITKLIETDPERAADWVPAQLPHFKPEQRFKPMVEIALAAAKIKPALAAQLFTEAKARKLDDGQPKYFGTPLLAALAARLGHDKEAEQLAAEAIDLARNTVNKEEIPDRLATVAAALAKGSASLALHALKQITVAPRSEFERSYAYSRAIEELAKHDLAGAQQLLEELGAIEHRQAQQAFSQSALAVIQRLSKFDAKAALALARRVGEDHRAQALLPVAQAAPQNEVLLIVREAVAAVPASYWNSGVTLASIARVAAQSDAAAGKEMLELVQARIDTLKQNSGGPMGGWRMQQGSLTVAAYAVALSRLNPMQSRIMLEEEWAFTRSQNHQLSGHNPQIILATAMAAVDPERALELSWQVEDRKGNVEMRDGLIELRNVDATKTNLSPQFEAQRQIARFLLAPSAPISELWKQF